MQFSACFAFGDSLFLFTILTITRLKINFVVRPLRLPAAMCSLKGENCCFYSNIINHYIKYQSLSTYLHAHLKLYFVQVSCLSLF